MDYKTKHAKKKREALITFGLIAVCALGVGIYLFINRMAVSWDKPEFEISTYRDKEARIVGRMYELEHQQALFEALQTAVDTTYIATKGGKKRAPHGLTATFSETFKQELIVVVETKPDAVKQWEKKFTRDTVDAGIVALGKTIGEELAGM